MIKIPATELAKALSAAASIVETKNMLPILAMVKLDAADGNLTVTTSNLDTEYRQTLPADIEAPFSCCVDAGKLANMASAAKAAISMSLDGHILTVKSGRSRWAAPSLRSDEFPLMPVDKLSKPMAIDWSFADRVTWAASKEVNRAYLSGMFMNDEAGKACYVSTNGYRVAMVQSQSKWPKGAPDVIVPANLAKIIAGIGPGSLEWDNAKMRFIADGVTVTGKAIDGTFPDYRSLFNRVAGDLYAIDATEMLDAVRRVRIGSDAKERKLRITRKQGGLHLRIEGTSGFEGEEEIPADCEAGFETGVNADYLAAMLGALNTDSIAVTQDGPAGLMHFRPIAQSPDITFEGLLGPMRI